MKRVVLFCVAALLVYVLITNPAIVSWVVGMPTNQQKIQVPAFFTPSDTITGAPTISALYIENQLCTHTSPACGTGQALYDLGKQYGIDPAYALAFFQHESGYGTAGMARVTKSLGNSICMTGYACVNGFASFPTWQVGYKAWYILMTSNVYVGSGLTTLQQIIPKYAPASDGNDPTSYIAAVESSVAQYRSESK